MNGKASLTPEAVQARFGRALEAVVEQVRTDRSVLAAVLCGSLSHDTVWDKSDIDLLLVTIDDRKVEASGRALWSDGVNVHALLVPRAEFRRMAEGTLRNSFMHSFLARGRLLYTHDPTIADLFASLVASGERDLVVQRLQAATHALAPFYKARKWLLTRGDLEYAALWILFAAAPLAKIEVMEAGLIADREVLPQAFELNPALFGTLYKNLLNEAKTAETVSAALDAMAHYLGERATTLFAPVLEHLREVDEVRSATEIEAHFARHFGIEGVTAACEYLADLGLIGKTGTSVQLTRRSNTSVEELAFFHLAGDAGGSGPGDLCGD